MILNGYNRGFLHGATMVISEFDDASIVIHGPMGCFSQYAEATAATQRWTYFTSSCMNEHDTILGGEQALKNALKSMKKSEAQKVRFIIASYTPLIIGDDIESIIDEMKKEVNSENLIPIVASVDSNHYDGIDLALAALSRHFTHPQILQKNCVNLIGNIGGSTRWKADLVELGRLLESIGIEVNLIPINLNRKKVENWSRASLTIQLIPEIGNLLSDDLHERFGIKSLKIEAPYGFSGTTRWIKSIAEELNLDYSKIINERELFSRTLKIAANPSMFEQKLAELEQLRIGIVAEQGVIIPVIQFLRTELGIKPIFAVFRTGKSLDIIPKSIEGVKTFFQIDRDTVQNNVLKNNIHCLLGSSYELEMVRPYGGSWIHLCNPNYHLVNLNPVPYMGFVGAMNFIQDILNLPVNCGPKGWYLQ